MTSTLVVGSTRSGKSVATIKTVVEIAQKDDSAIVIVDPHRDSLAAGAFEHLVARGFQRRFLLMRLADLDRVIAWDFLAPSTAQNKLERAAENDERLRSFQDVLTRRRNVDSLSGSPLLEESMDHRCASSCICTNPIASRCLFFDSYLSLSIRSLLS